MEDPLKRALQLAEVLQPSIKVVSITMDRAKNHMTSVVDYKTIARHGYVLLNGQIIYVQIDYSHLYKSFMRAIIGGDADIDLVMLKQKFNYSTMNEESYF
jgi:hypothetical protein